MNKKNNWLEIKSILDRNNIRTLYHFTDRSNLTNIVKNGGLYSWNDCLKKGITIPRPGGGGPDSLSWALDAKNGLENYVRVSFTKHHPMMFVALNEGRITEPVILEINPEVIFWQETKYANMNATKNGANIGGTLDDFLKIHFNSVKEVNHFVLLPEEQPYFQAEILIKNFIPLEYIYNIGNFVKSEKKPISTPSSSPFKPFTPADLVSNLLSNGSMDEAITMAATGLIPKDRSKDYIENYIDKYKDKKNYQREVIINNRSFKYIHSNGSSLKIIANRGRYHVTVFENNYKAYYDYLETDFENILLKKKFPSELIKEIGFLCQKNYEDRMAMGVMIQIIAHAEPMTEKFSKAVESVMKGYLYLPDDFDIQICYFTQEQIENIMNNMSQEKKRFLFVIMSKLIMSQYTDYKSGDILKIISSKRFLFSNKITERYNLPKY